MTTKPVAAAHEPMHERVISAPNPLVNDALKDAVRCARIKSLTPSGFEAFAEACMETEATSPEAFALGVLAIQKAAGGADAVVTAEDVAKAADQHRWDNNPAICSEFRTKEAYFGYQHGLRAGRIRRGRS